MRCKDCMRDSQGYYPCHYDGCPEEANEVLEEWKRSEAGRHFSNCLADSRSDWQIEKDIRRYDNV